MLASTAAITALAWLNVRPSLEEVITWVDVETLVLLFGMMVIVSVISETGEIYEKLPYLIKIGVVSSTSFRNGWTDSHG